MNETLTFQVKFEDIKPFNSEFSYCKIYTLYTGINRNNSHLTKDTVTSSLEGLYNIPIIGEYLEDSENFGGHGGKWEITDRGINYIQTTKAFGVVPESAEVYWENVTESDGKVNEYLVIDKAVLWTGRFNELTDILSRPYGQSMEINIDSGDYIEVDGVKTYDIKKFTWSALCILGIEKDGEGKVEPCFESASIVGYSLDKEKFKAEFSLMLKELKYSLQHNDIAVAEVLSEGGNKVVPEEIVNLLQKYSLTENDLIEKNIVYTEFSIEDLETKLIETSQVIEDEVKTEEDVLQFSLTSEQMESELRRELAAIETLTEVYWDEVYTSPRYYYRDHKPEEKIVIAVDEKNWFLVGLPYSVIGDALKIDASSIARYKVDYTPMNLSGEVDVEFVEYSLTSKNKAEFMVTAKEKSLVKQFEAEKETITSELNAKITELQEKYTILESKMAEVDAELAAKLKAERTDAENAIFESFSKSLSEEEMADIKSKKSEFSLQEIEDKLCVILGKKTISATSSATFSVKVEEEVKPLRYSIISENVKPVSEKSYADLIKTKE